MSWRDERRPASFRGVAFEAVEISAEEGRRYVADETPETDALAPTNDLGRIRPKFRIRCFVVGDDYLDRRDALRAALNSFGPGELVHPWRGRMRVQVGAVSFSMGPGNGACTFEFSCEDAGGEALPLVTVVPASQATDQAALASAEATAIYGATGDDGNIFLVEAGRFDDYVTLAGGLSAYLDNAGAWSAATAEAMAEALQTVADARALLEFVRSAAAYVWHSLGTPTDETRRVMYANIADGMRLLCLVRVAELTTEAAYVTADQAEEAMGAVALELTDWMAATLDSTLYLALLALRTAMVDVLTDASERLPRERTITIPVPTPTIVIAFDTYGAKRLAAREAEIVQINGIGHLGFVVGPIKVLSQ